MTADARFAVGVVIIGRNEGERLRRCLESVSGNNCVIVYVDSGSTDGSIALAESLGAIVVILDQSIPFTAARARNAGWRRLIEIAPEVEFVQFVDGDCEVNANWIDIAVATLRQHPETTVVCGRRRERFPDASVYNRLCDLEWDTPIGPADACGGDALMRIGPLKAVGGFRDDMIAGEEPELCLRLRQHGGQILRIDQEMTLHDAAMTTFRQWWTRAVRAGHAYAEGATLARCQSPGLWQREERSIWFWGIVLPTIALTFAWWTRGLSLLLLTAYIALWLRVFVRTRRRHAGLYATFCVIAKFAHTIGMGRYYRHRLFGRRSRLIEYKNPGPVVSSAS